MSAPEGGRSQLPWWLMLLGVMGFAAIPGKPTSGGDPKAAAKATDAFRKSAEAEGDPLLPVREYWSAEPRAGGPIGVVEAPGKRDDARGLWGGFPLDKDLVEPLIAIVPDPIDTSFAARFDLCVEAIIRAMSMEGFVPDRAWLVPWQRDAKGEPKPGRLNQTEPGALVFRKADDKPIRDKRIAVVLLVGEGPKTGVAKAAFARAVRLLAPVVAGRKPAKRLEIVGPGFSGTADSLGPALDAVRGEFPFGYRFFATSAAGLSKANFEARVAGVGKADVEMFRTSHTEKAIFDRVVDYIKSRNPGGTKIVVLQESDTSFGASPPKLAKERVQIISIPFPMHVSRLRGIYDRDREARDRRLGLPQTTDVIPIPNEERDSGDFGPQAPELTSLLEDQQFKEITRVISREDVRYVGLIASDNRDKLFLAQLVRKRCPDVTFFSTGVNDLLLTHPDYSYAMRGTIVGQTYPQFASNQLWTAPYRGDSRRSLFAQQIDQSYYNAVLLCRESHKNLLEYAVPRWPGDTAPAPDVPPVWISAISPSGELVPLKVYRDEKPDDKPDGKSDKPTTFDGMLAIAPASANEKCPDLSAIAATPSYFTTLQMAFLAWTAMVLRGTWRYLRIAHRESGSRLGRAMLPQRCLGAFLCFGSLAFAMLYHLMRCFPLRPAVVPVAVLILESAGAILATIGALSSFPAIYRRVWSQPIDGASVPLRERDAFWIVVAVAVAPVALRWAYPLWEGSDSKVQAALDYFRTVRIGAGLSPVPPVTLACMCYFAMGYWMLKRLQLLTAHSVPCPFPKHPSFNLCGLRGKLLAVRRVLFAPQGLFFDPRFRPAPARGLSPRPAKGAKAKAAAIRRPLPKINRRAAVAYAATFLAAFGLAAQVYALSTSGFDGHVFNAAFLWIGFSLPLLFIAFTALRAFLLWDRIQRLYRHVAAISLGSAFERLPHAFLIGARSGIDPLYPRLSRLELSVHLAARLQRGIGEYRRTVYLVRKPDEDLIADLDRFIPLRLRGGADPGGTAARDIEETFDADRRSKSVRPFADTPTVRELTRLSRAAVLILRHSGRDRSTAEAFGNPSPAAAKAPAATGAAAWIATAEELVATQLLYFIDQFRLQKRALINNSSVASLLLLMAVLSYPFHPQSYMIFVLLGVLGAIAVQTALVSIAINRNPLLSRVSGTAPNQFNLDWHFAETLSKTVLPFAAAIAFQFPSVGSAVRALFEPFLRVLQ